MNLHVISESAECQAKSNYLISLVFPQLIGAFLRLFSFSVSVFMELVSDSGRTSIVSRLRDGLVLKLPRTGLSKEFLDEIHHAFDVEHALLQRLGDHPGIVRYVPSLITVQS
jgi:hypothetical protein